MTIMHRRLAVGAEVQPGGGVHFRVWAPRARGVEVVCAGGHAARLQPEADGHFSGHLSALGPGTSYRYRLDGRRELYPDPASRFQPEGPHGPSQVVDPGAFRWTDDHWTGVSREGQVIYELHIGTFTREGTWQAAQRELRELAAAGVTMVEVMPIADFAGRFGWGYDGVNLFAPTRLYGAPDDLRAFVDAAHAAGLGVILDVVYNHFGPDGNYLREFSAEYTTDRYTTDWGEAINFDGDGCAPVRELFIANAGYWIDEYHFDGLRLDATQNIYDRSDDHILAAIVRRVRAAGRGRHTFVVAENEPQHSRLVKPAAEGGYGLDALWNDDYHHSAFVALTGRAEAYYNDHRGTPQELISAAKWGYLYQGQFYAWQKQPRGTPTVGLRPSAFVNFLENHDQVANSGRGERVHQLTSPGRHRALTAFTLLAPGTPMLFQGQEFSASSPFLYFADHSADLAKLVAQGRREFLAQFPSLATPEMQAHLPDPGDPEVFERCKLDFGERLRHAGAYALHRDLVALRRDHAVFHAPRAGGIDGAVLSEHAFALRYFGVNEDTAADRLLLVNLGRDLELMSVAEPLLAPPLGTRWALLWSSEDPRYGGCGTVSVETGAPWHLAAETAIVLQPTPQEASTT